MKYSCLKSQVHQYNRFSIRPIRYEDRYDIMKWRNEQMYHLRQSKPLTEDDQERYFSNVVTQLFDKAQPEQILFSYLENDVCIGYGGLVHINWIDKNAELSFIMDTMFEELQFGFHWQMYLRFIEKVAFLDLGLHKIYTYAFDLRPHLYEAVESSGFKKEAVLKEHCLFNGEYIDVVIHTKYENKLKFRKPVKEDAKLYFDWASDSSVRSNSYNSSEIDFDAHVKWFNNKLEDQNCFMYLFQNEKDEYIGQVRIQKLNEFSSNIGVSIDENQRGKGYANKIIEIASNEFLKDNDNNTIDAFIKHDNILSAKSFEKAGFKLKEVVNFESVKSFHYIKT